MEEPIRIFKCPCEGNKFILAGQPNENPSLKQNREYGEYLSMGCSVITIPIEQFRSEGWMYCGNHNKK
jgi:hypothetical protein